MGAVLFPCQHISEFRAVSHKLGLTMPHIYRSQIHLASLQLVLLPFCGFVYLGWARVTRQVFSRILNTGIQHFSVDSMQMPKQ